MGPNDANGDGLDDLQLDTEDSVRGAASLHFATEATIQEDYVSICDPTGQFECTVPDELIPRSAFTVAAWMKAEQTGTDQSILQTRSAEGSFTHIQLQGNGRFKMQLRGQQQSENIVAAQLFMDGSTDNADAPYPFDEWFHFAGTYDMECDDWGLYFNGTRIAGGAANGGSGPLEIGDWGTGATLGMVPDFNRQLVGKMDEFYLFTRALSAQEISSLANPPTDPVTPDFDGDGMIDLADFQILADNFNTEGPHENGDLTFDGIINLADFVKFRTAFASGQPQLAAVPEPSGGLLMKMSALAALHLLGRRRMQQVPLRCHLHLRA